MEFFEKLGLTKFYPKKLCVRDAIQIREDILQLPKEYPIELYAFKMLQKVITFDSQCRFKYAGKKIEKTEDKSSNDDDDDDDDESDKDDGVHPLDCLIALIHCSDNFLRQDLFSRLATCQIAVPLLLPDPITKVPNLLMWAMRAIMKECKLSNETMIYSGRIITRPTTTVSFMRLGSHLLSKSEIINGVMNRVDSDNKIVPFFGYTSPGSSNFHVLLNGLLEVCWYLPGNDLFPEPMLFTNLRGDAYEGNFDKQINFVCEIATVHVVLVSDEILRQEKAIRMLQRFAEAPEGVILLQTSTKKEFKDEVNKLVRGKVSVLKSESNPTALFEKIQRKLIKLSGNSETRLAKLSGHSNTHLSDVARKCFISIDEDKIECVTGKVLSNELLEVIKQYQLANPDKSPKNLLPLQSENLWHKWAALDKEQYRLRKKNDDDQARKAKNDKVLSVKQYEEEQRHIMEEKRCMQYDETNNINNLMKLFLEGIRSENEEVRRYFLMWIKMKLDDLSRKTLPTYRQRIKMKREELYKIQQERNESDEQKCKLELKNLDKRLINASFGVEHLFRELGQLYECVATFEDVNNPRCIVKDLPYIAAELMHEGFPLELLDGDASHMPKQWISAVFDKLSDIVKISGRAQNLYVLSVLGIQSTGKSTLLNTVFGVQFSVSSGRCTRGAFMQLIPTHPSLFSQTGIGHILLIDTEGIRAPELDKLESREHDNELATFVIGIANLTLINVAGEVAGEIDDVLNASVHAFLRMKEVKLKTSCYIIHQNVAVIGADKLLQARQKTKDKLDTMTKAAAVDTGLESKYTYFHDVIEFNHETDVSEFVGLWNGELPMARVSSGYSSRAQALKLRVIKKCGHFSKQSKNSILSFSTHLDNLWDAIIQEDFVFTFQNTFEIVSFKNLEVKYSDIACNFTTFMGNLQKAAENELFGCEAEKLKHTFDKYSKEIPQKADEKYEECVIEMEEYIKADEIMLKWKHEMMRRLQQLHEQLSETALNGCHQMFQAKKDRMEFDDDKEYYGKCILEEVQKLVKKLGDVSLSDKALKMKFGETWRKIMENIKVKTFETPNIPHEVEESLRKFLLGANRSLLHQKLAIQDIREYGPQFENMVIQDFHLKEYQERRLKNILKDAASYYFSTTYFIQQKEKALEEVRCHMYETCFIIRDHLQKIRISGRNFHTQFVTDMLTTIQLRNKQFKGPKLTIEFEVDMDIIACGYAMPIFEEMVEEFRRMHDTQLYIQEEMRPRFENMFINMFTKAGNEKIAAEAMCQQLKRPICDYVIENLPSIIIEKMRIYNPWMKDKQRFIAKTLLEIGQMLNNESVDGFACCMEFVTNPGKSLEKWAKTFTERHCKTMHNGKTNLAQLALDKMNEVIDSLIKATDEVSDSYKLKSKVNCVEWLEKFHAKVTHNMKLSLSDLKMYVQVTELSHLELFTTIIIEKLNQYRSELETEFLNIKYSKTEKRESAHINLFKSIAGCTHQCPFCGAQCELTIDGHEGTVKHSTQHRPQALKKRRWDANNEMVLDICSYDVASDDFFRNADTKGEYFPYKRYSEKYPTWDIPADKSFTASLFWKWFIGNYSSDIEEEFKFSKTNVSNEWQNIKWHEVKCWIEKNYNLKLII